MITSKFNARLSGGGDAVLPPSNASFVLGLKHPVVSGAEIISEGTECWRSSVHFPVQVSVR